MAYTYENQHATIVDLIAAGEIGGLVNGLNSVYLNGTALLPDSSRNLLGKSGIASVSGTSVTDAAGLFSGVSLSDGDRYLQIKGAGPSSTTSAQIFPGTNRITTASSCFLNKHATEVTGSPLNYLSTAAHRIRIAGAGLNGAEYSGIIITVNSTTSAQIFPPVSTTVASGAAVTIDDLVKVTAVANANTATLQTAVSTSVTAAKVTLSGVGVISAENQDLGELAYDNVSAQVYKGTRNGISTNSPRGGAQTANFVIASGQALKLVSGVTTGYGSGSQSPAAGALTSGGLSLPQNSAQEIDRVRVNIKFPGGLRHVGSEKGQDEMAFAEFQIVLKYKTTENDPEQAVLVHGKDYGGTNFLDNVPNWNTGTITSNYKRIAISSYANALSDGTAGVRIAGGNTGIIRKKGNNPPFVATFDVDLKKFQPFSSWSIEVRRLSPEDAKSYAFSENVSLTATLDSFDCIIEDKFNYPTSAHSIISYSAEDFQQVPSRAYHIYGKLVKVPSNYIPREESSTGVAKYTRNSSGVDTGSYVPWSGQMRGDYSLSPANVNFRKVYTNNPAWIFYDILTNPDYGLGEFLLESDIDKFSLYQIARYCDELVSDGKGGLEPRFTCNVYIAQASEAYKVIKDLASSFRGMLGWIDGQITAIQDSPKEAVYTFTKGNVEEGLFEYTYTGQRARPNQINVTYNNPDEFYKKTVLTVEDTANIIKQGKIVGRDVVAFGCTSESQARRLAQWNLATDTQETEVVSFTTGINSSFLRPGDIINVQDKDIEGVEHSGRVSTGSTTSAVVLDREVDFGEGSTVGTSCKLTIIFPGAAVYLAQEAAATIGSGSSPPSYTRGSFLPEVRDSGGNLIDLVNNPPSISDVTGYFDNAGNNIVVQYSGSSRIETKDITNTGTTATTITVNGAFSQAPLQDYIWAIISDDESSETVKKFRVAGLAEDEEGKFSISATEYEETKFDEIDFSVPIYTTGYTPVTAAGGAVPPPSGVSVELVPVGAVSADGNFNSYNAIVSWTPPTEAIVDSANVSSTVTYRFVENYEISHDLVNEGSSYLNMKTEIAEKGATSFTIYNVSGGDYTVKIRTVNTLAAKSPWRVSSGELSAGLFGDTAIQQIATGGSLSAPYTFDQTAGTFIINAKNFDITPPNSNKVSFSSATALQRTESFSGMSTSDTVYLYFDTSSAAHPLRSFVLHTDEVAQDADGNDLDISYFKERGAANNGLTTVTGTVSITVASNTVTGSGTSFTDLAVGTLIKVTSGSSIGTQTAASEYRTISKILSDTSLEVVAPFTRTLSSAYIYRTAFTTSRKEDCILGEVAYSGSSYTFTPFLSTDQPLGGYSVFMGNESHVFQADPQGNVQSLTGADFQINVFNGNVRYYLDSSASPADNTYKLGTISQNPSNGLTVSSGTTGSSPAVDSEIDITGVLASNDSGRMDIPIIINHDGPTFTKTFSYSKARQGVDGDGTAVVYAYQRSATALTSDPGNVTVSLQSGQITTNPLSNGWSKLLPSGTDPLYVVAATASGTGNTATISNTEWSDPVIFSRDGQAGLNAATVRLFKRNASSSSAGNLPTGNTTYTFETGDLSFTNPQGWADDVPSTGGAYLWTTQATAISTSDTDVILQGEWAPATIMAQDGGTGDDGLRTVQGYLYYEKTTSGSPSDPSGNTYTFDTGLVTGTGIASINASTTNVWTNAPRTQDPASSNTHYTIRYYGEEASASSSTVAVNYTGVVQYTNFDGVVTFSNGTFKEGSTDITAIDGGNITTGTISATQLAISNNASGSAGIFMDATNNAPRIDIRDSSNVLRVRIGKL